MLSKRLRFLSSAYLGKVGESAVDSLLRKATGGKKDYKVETLNFRCLNT